MEEAIKDKQVILTSFYNKAIYIRSLDTLVPVIITSFNPGD